MDRTEFFLCLCECLVDRSLVCYVADQGEDLAPRALDLLFEGIELFLVEVEGYDLSALLEFL